MVHKYTSSTAGKTLGIITGYSPEYCAKHIFEIIKTVNVVVEEFIFSRDELVSTR